MKQTVTLTSLSGSLGTSVKIILTFLFLNLFVQKTSAQYNIDGSASDWGAAGHVLDEFESGIDDGFTEGSKDFHFAADWRWVLGQVKGKNDIANGSGEIVPNILFNGVPQVGGPFLAFAGDRIKNEGSSNIGFWFFQNGTAPTTQANGTRNFAPAKTVGDILIIADFSGGGRNADITVLRWVGTGGTYPNSDGAFNQVTIGAGIAQNNDATTPVPGTWTFPQANYDQNMFYEGFVDLGQFGPGAACFSRFMLETRSSPSITASLDDFIGGPLGGVPTCDITGNNTVCAGSSTCFTSAPNTSYSWTGPNGYTASTQVACNITAAGTYNLTVTNSTGCTSTCSRILTVNNAPTAGAGPDDAKCQTAPSGPTAFTLAGTGTNGTFAWTQIASTGGASASITSPTSLTSGVSVSGIGTVTLRLTTTSNASPSCGTATDNVVLTVNANPTANAGPDDAKCQTAPSGPTAFTLAGTGANGTFAWTQIASTGGASASITTPGSLTSGVSVSGIGTVTLRLTTTSNASPSCGTATDNVVLTVNANPTANAGPDDAKCQTAPSGPTAFTLAGTGANGTFAWTQIASTGGASASITTPGSLTSGVSVSGIGTVTLRLTTTSEASPSCGTATDNVILTVNANPTANAGPDEAKCQTAPSGPTAFTLAGTGANGTFAWTQVGSTGSASASITTPGSLTSAVSVSGIGTVTLRLTTTSNASPSCGTATDNVILTVNANPTANAGPDDTKCQTAPSGPTAFTLAGTGANGTFGWTQIASTGTASASITSPTSLTSGVSVSGIGTVTLRLTTTSNASPSCGTATDNVVLEVTTIPTANAGPDDTKCQTPPSGPTAFTLAGTGAGTASWTQIGSTGSASASITTPSSLTSGVNVSGIGTVTLRLSVASASCGTATDNVVLTVNANPTANAGPDDTKCQTAPSGPTAFTLAGTGANGTFAWAQIGSTGTASASITSPTSLTSGVSVSGIGTVTLRLTTTSNASPSCGTATDNVVLTVNPNPTANAGPNDAQCRVAAVTNNSLAFGTNQFSVTGIATNAASVSWAVAPGGNTSGYTVNILSPSSLSTNVDISGAVNGGSVTLRFTANSNASPSCGTATDDVVLTLNPRPLLKQVLGSDFCPNVTATGSVRLFNSEALVSYQLKDDGNNNVQGPQIGDGGTLTWNGLADGSYTVVGTWVATGCNTTAGPATVIENPVPVVILTPFAQQCNDATTPPISLILLANILGGEWSGPGVLNGIFNPAGLAPGTYTLTYAYTNSFGCRATAQLQSTVVSCAAQICTYTQGYFGNPGGLSCDGENGGLTTTALINQSLGNWPGASLKIGVSQLLPTNIQNYVQIDDLTGAACVIEVLPGGGPAKEISGANNICSLPPAMLQNGRIKNVLLAQTIALGLNIGINPPDLGDFALRAGTLYTAEPVGGCGSSVPKLRRCIYDEETGLLDHVENEYESRSFSQALIDAIEDAGYPKTVGGLFALANDALGNKDGVIGTEQGLSLSEIAGGAGSINEVFDECRISVGWDIGACAPSDVPSPARINVNASAEAATIGKLKVSTYPNPYRSNVRFVIESPVAGQAILDVYNLAGQKVQTVFNGHIDANETRIIDYKPTVANGMLIYTLRIGNRQVTGKLIGLKE